MSFDAVVTCIDRWRKIVMVMRKSTCLDELDAVPMQEERPTSVQEKF